MYAHYRRISQKEVFEELSTLQKKLIPSRVEVPSVELKTHLRISSMCFWNLRKHFSGHFIASYRKSEKAVTFYVAYTEGHFRMKHG